MTYKIRLSFEFQQTSSTYIGGMYCRPYEIILAFPIGKEPTTS